MLGIRKTITTPLHLQSNGNVERQHQIILNCLSKYISDNQKDWDPWVLLFLLAYRSSKHTTTGATPAEMYTSSDLRLTLDLIRGCPPDDFQGETYNNYVQQLRQELDEIHKITRRKWPSSPKRQNFDMTEEYDALNFWKVKKSSFSIHNEWKEKPLNFKRAGKDLMKSLRKSTTLFPHNYVHTSISIIPRLRLSCNNSHYSLFYFRVGKNS